MIFLDKRHWPQFGIITCFLWIKGTGLRLVLLRVCVDKRQWPEFGIITSFLCMKSSVLRLVLLRVFCG